MINKQTICKSLIINRILLKGKKQRSEKTLLQILKLIQKNNSKNHKDLIKFFVIKMAPIVTMKLIKRKKKQVKEFPYLVKSQTRYSKALKNVTKIVLKKENKKLLGNFVEEFNYTLKNKNKNKQLLHEYAFTTKKLAHYRWFY
uniref:ribosomal protein S7 n=1 Tax=Odontella aurita TaxID=265563 RepID=UPI00202962F0|nr:ribosomal protein S7 [Odontella aurita]QYB22950.1 ribosomal protein S7 [Odontella aurita]